MVGLGCDRAGFSKRNNFQGFGRLLAVLALGWAAVTAHAMTYQYDDAGRLMSATNASGDTAVYRYDSRGNLLGITRLSSTTLNIASFSPRHGEPGIEVRISGSGFSTTPANNDVEFNGTAAAVLSATSTQLLVMVPIGATSGPIEVTVGGNTVASADDFEVNTLGLPPVISGFSPSKGNPGATVTITGSHLEPYPGLTNVEINGLFVPVTSVTDVEITFTVPAWVGSGPLTITTAFGQAVASSPFLVVPANMSASAVTDYSLLPLGNSQAITLASSNTYGALTFEGNEGDYLNLQVSSFTSSINSVSYVVYGTTNTVLLSGTVTPTNPTILLPVLTRDGTYSIFFGSGAGTASLTVASELVPTIETDGATLNFTTTTSHQKKRYIFVTEQGADLGGGFWNMTGSAAVTPNVYKPDGGLLTSSSCAVSWGCAFNIVNAPVAGTYVVVLEPTSSGGTFSLDAVLSNDQTGFLANDTPQLVNITRRGQNGRYTFSATAGAHVALRIDTISTNPAGAEVYLRIYRPNGTQIGASYYYTHNGTIIRFGNLPETGTYEVWLDVNLNPTLSAYLTILTPAANTVVADEASLVRSAPGSWRSLYFTFAGTASENLGLGFSSVTGSSSISVRRPDGAEVGNTVCNWMGCHINLKNLPVSGTYAVLVTPNNSAAFGFTATLSHDIAGSLSADTPQSLSITRRGQNANLTFAGTAGMAAGLEIDGVSTTPSDKWVDIFVYKPDGSILSTNYLYTGTVINLTSLPSTGTYSVFIDPDGGATTPIRVNLATSATSAVAVDGSSLSVSTSVGGEHAYFNFVASSGANLGLGISSLTQSSGTTTTLRVFSPTGAQISSQSCLVSAGGCQVNIPNAVAGTYAATITPNAGATMGFNATVSTDLTGTLTGSSQSISIARRGQNARYSFAGTSGTSVSIPITGITTTPSGNTVNFRILKPDGTELATGSGSSSYTFNLSNLPATGTYKLTADPNNGATASFDALVQ